MINQLLRKKKTINLERSYSAPAETVWQAWTRPEMLRQWWGPEKTTVTECRIDLRLGGEIYLVTEAGSEMGKYAGTRWPMAGTFTLIEPNQNLAYDARSWTEGEEDASTIHHANHISFTEVDGTTTVNLRVTITKIGPKAKMAAFGMKWGYKQQLDNLAQLLSTPT